MTKVFFKLLTQLGVHVHVAVKHDERRPRLREGENPDLPLPPQHRPEETEMRISATLLTLAVAAGGCGVAEEDGGVGGEHGVDGGVGQGGGRPVARRGGRLIICKNAVEKVSS